MFAIAVVPDTAVNTINSLPDFMLKNLILAKHLMSVILSVVTNKVPIRCFIQVTRASTVLPNKKFRISIGAFIFVYIYKSSNLPVS